MARMVNVTLPTVDEVVSDIINNGSQASTPYWASKLTPLELAAQRNELLADLIEAEATFRHYAELHAAKGTPDGDEKAAKNRVLADRFAATIAKARGEI